MLKIIFSLSGVLLAGSACAATPIVWQATFHDVMPNNNQVTQAYCIDHSPDFFQTTVKAILGRVLWPKMECGLSILMSVYGVG